MALDDNLLESWWLNNNVLGATGLYDGVNYNVTFDGVNQKVGSHCGVFNGINAEVKAPTISGALINGSYSGAVWINLNSIPAFATFMSVGIASGGVHGFSLDTSNVSNGLRIYAYGNTGDYKTITVANALNGEEGNWHLVGFTLDTIAGFLSLYQNGSPVGSVATGLTGLENDAVGLNIGSLNGIRFVDGLIDAPVLINGAWSDADHLAYYAGIEIGEAVVAGNINRKLGRGLARGLGRGL